MADNISHLMFVNLPDGSRWAQVVIPGGLDTGMVREPDGDPEPANTPPADQEHSGQ